MKKIITILFKVIAGIVLTPIIIIMIWSILRLFACNPDREVVKVASPVAKIIADDILKNGIPKSLKDIDGLPYALEECKRSDVFKKSTAPTTIVSTKEQADFGIREEKCFFITNKMHYHVAIFFTEDFKTKDNTSGSLTIFNGETRTGIDYHFDYSKETNKFILKKGYYDYPRIYDSKKTGICFRWGH